MAAVFLSVSSLVFLLLLLVSVCVCPEPFSADSCRLTDGECEVDDVEQCEIILSRMRMSAGPDPCKVLRSICSSCSERAFQIRSCLQEVSGCLGQERCNREMILLVQACDPLHCNSSHCGRAVRSFYSALPRETLESLVFCGCGDDEDDGECQRMKTVLHSGSCGTETPRTCPEMLDRCFRDTQCSETFSGFLYKCFASEEIHEDYPITDWLHLVDLDLLRGTEAQCRAAYTDTMGSLLQQPCTCDGLHPKHQQECHLLQQMFHKQSVFTSPRGPSGQRKVKQKTSEERTDEVMDPEKRGDLDQQETSGQLLVFLLYVSLVASLVVSAVGLLLHRLWRNHRAACKAANEPRSKSAAI